MLFILPYLLYSSLWSQYLRDSILTDYNNYGKDQFQQENTSAIYTNQYDDLGNFLIKGARIYSWKELRPGFPYRGSFIYKSPNYTAQFKNLVVGLDEYGKNSSRIYVGDAIDTKFTSLTLDMARFNGIRWDFYSPQDRITLVGSRLSNPLFQLNIKPTLAQQDMDRDGVFLVGGRWENNLGEILKVGINGLNVHRVESLLDAKLNRLRGITNNARPKRVLFVIRDDSPGQGRGAFVYDVDFLPAAAGTLKESFLVQDLSSFDLKSYIKSGTGKGISVDLKQPPEPFELNGNSGLVLDFVVTDTLLKTLSLRADVAGDYFIGFAPFHDYYLRDFDPVNLVWFTNPAKKDLNMRGPNFFLEGVRATGNVQDYSNRRTEMIAVTEGSGLSILGGDIAIRLGGWELQGEYEYNMNFYQFPVHDGKASDIHDQSFFLRLKKTLKDFSLGGEYFHLGGNYKTDLVIYRENSFKENTVKLPNADQNPRGIIPTLSGQILRGENAPEEFKEDADREYGYSLFSLVDDNDDKDPWPDYMEDNAFFLNFKNLSPRPVNYGPSNEVFPEDIRSYQGIYPGLDEDKDRIPDINRNNNEVVDFREPFMMYYVDPDRLTFGPDFNNNGLIDYRENNNQPDYLYKPDQKGFHYFGIYKPSFLLFRGLKFTIGGVAQTEILGGNQSSQTYQQTEYVKKVLGMGELDFKIQTKRVRDDIRDDVIETVVEGIDSFFPVLRDPLRMRNSLFHLFYLGSAFRFIPNLTVYNNFKIEWNNQYETLDFTDGSSQAANEIQFVGMVNKADYTLRWGKLEVIPQIKLLIQREKESLLQNATLNELEIAPILRLNYRFTDNTMFQGGIQGFPGLENYYIDYLDRDKPKEDSRSYRAKNYIFLLSNQSKPYGLKVFLQMGFSLTQKFYLRSEKDFDNVSSFVKVFTGI